MWKAGQNVNPVLARHCRKAELFRNTIYAEAEAEDFEVLEMEEQEGLCFVVLGEPFSISFGIGFGEFDLWNEDKLLWHALVRYRSARDTLIKENGGTNTNAARQ